MSFSSYQAYGDSSFQDCKKASEEAMETIIRNLEVFTFYGSTVFAYLQVGRYTIYFSLIILLVRIVPLV